MSTKTNRDKAKQRSLQCPASVTVIVTGRSIRSIEEDTVLTVEGSARYMRIFKYDFPIGNYNCMY